MVVPSLVCYLVVADYRYSRIYIIVEGLCLVRREIDTAMTSVVLIDRSSEAAPPVGVMKTDTAVKRHPVIYMALIRVSAVGPLPSS